MWTCPKCKHQFFNKNQSHSCGDYTLEFDTIQLQVAEYQIIEKVQARYIYL